jgi:hypothetical protein
VRDNASEILQLIDDRLAQNLGELDALGDCLTRIITELLLRKAPELR